MDQAQISKLHQDATLGRVAEHAYDSYLKSKFDELEKELFQSFLAATPDDSIIELKRLSMVLGALKQRVQVDIENGHLAQKQLTEETKH